MDGTAKGESKLFIKKYKGNELYTSLYKGYTKFELEGYNRLPWYDLG